jgi:uncharacterized RDD family membrane protein YckC
VSDPRTASSRLLPPGLVFSDTPSRLWAYVLDGFVLGPIYAVIFAVFGFDYSTIRPGAFPDRNVWVVSSVITLALNGLYFIWFWSGGRRATPGQRVMGIQIANAFDGRPLTTSQAINRYLAMGQWVGILAVLPYIATAVLSIVLAAVWYIVLLISSIASPTKQGLHDRYAGSAVVRSAAAGNRWAVGCLWLVILFAAFYVLFFAWFFTNVPSSEFSNRYMLDYLWETFRWFWPQ